MGNNPINPIGQGATLMKDEETIEDVIEKRDIYLTGVGDGLGIGIGLSGLILICIVVAIIVVAIT